MSRGSENLSLSERLAEGLHAFRCDDLTPRAIEVLENEFLEALGLMIAARRGDCMAALLASIDTGGPCLIPGYRESFGPEEAALAGGVAVHGEDFDDTLEGAPIRVAAMVLPAVLAAGQRHGKSGLDVFLGAAAGMEALCRVNRLAPRLIHARDFHPVGVPGPFGAAAGISRTLGQDWPLMARGFGLAGSFSSGIL